MIRRNVDVIAVTVLLCGIGLYTRARDARILEVIPNKRIALSEGSLCRTFGAFQHLQRIQFNRH
jgi:hypothetical protein